MASPLGSLLSITTEGLKDLAKRVRFLALPGGVAKISDEGLKALEDFAQTAKSEAPKRSGFLGSSISTSTKKAGRGNVLGATTVDAVYGGPIHFGWKDRNIKPNKFMYRALEKKEADIAKSLERDIQFYFRHNK